MVFPRRAAVEGARARQSAARPQGECQARHSISSCCAVGKTLPILYPRCGAREHYGAGTEAKHTVPS